ncbi:MAG: type III pantothenate kinase [Deltaproteobacteria bacterium]|nr:type III pantothenate kinase [Deltaproteobacteria bacterium]
MLLVVDVGNTNTVLGVYEGDSLLAHWRIETKKGRTADEYAIVLRELFALSGLSWPSISAGIVSSVVPPVLFPIEDFFRRHLHVLPLAVGPGIRTGMPILYENPREVGADRIVNAVAAYDRFQKGCIVVDFGTATTFDVITPRGEYLGGAIAPGIMISADALYHAAAKLPRVELSRPAKVIGRNTIASIQSGLIFGYAGLVDSVVERMRAELDFPMRCLATGGLAPLIAKESRTIEEADEMLTLRGLKILFERNRS